MDFRFQEKMTLVLNNFHMPSYSEIPDVGLFLEQAAKFTAGSLSAFGSINITSSMISNYVKKKMIANPVKKQYYRDQIANIMIIAVAKTVLSLEEIQIMLKIQNENENFDCKTAYTYFCKEFEAALHRVFGVESTAEVKSGYGFGEEGEDKHISENLFDFKEKTLLKNTIIAVAHKIYLDECFSYIAEQEEENSNKDKEKEKKQR